MIRIRQIKILVDDYSYDKLVDRCADILKISKNLIDGVNIYRRSIDARKKPLIYYSFIVDINVKNEKDILKRNKNKDILYVDSEELKYNFIPKGDKVLANRPIIVGCGPCGLMAGYMLASYGYKPIIIERGSDVDTRSIDVEEFWNNNKLNINSNVLFGEGGAGTFSDGKLNTLVKDKDNYQRKVFKIFVENGAPLEILYESMPHIGTDLLRNMVKNIRNKIISMGGEVRFNTMLTDINIKDNKLVSIVVNDKDIINCDVLVLAIGHSARDTFRMLYDKKINMQSKPFAVGVRIQHPQDMINISQYGRSDTKLKNASYKLTYKASNGRGVYTFCMCPGGYVVNASSSENKLCINGMSNYNRDSGNANSAVIVTVNNNDYGNEVLDGVKFQEKLESIAYSIGNGNIPISLYKDYKNNTISSKFGNVIPVFKGNYKFANINEIFTYDINKSLKEGIDYFGTKIKDFDRDDAIVAGVEARTSSPIRIIRNDNLESNIKGIYPAGEGAGYAGGITTSCIDGIIVFEKISNIYKSF